MLLPCEVAVKSVLPALRGGLVKMLCRDFGMRQTRVAEILGITQGAVSHYLRGARGAAIAVEDVSELQEGLRGFAEALARRELTPSEQRERYCRLCNIVRAKGLMCRVHERYDPTVEAGECTFCKDIRYCPLAGY